MRAPGVAGRSMKRILITGMSATGKSTVVRELLVRGHRAVDLDDPQWSEWIDVVGNPTGAKRHKDWAWRADRVGRLLDAETERPFFASGCAPNMGTFVPSFDEIVLLTAPTDVIRARLAARSAGSYGTRPEEVAAVLANLEAVEPRLRRIAGHVIDTRTPLDLVVERIAGLGTA